MALQKMKSMQTKSKGRKRNGRFEKVKLSTKKDTNSVINPDLSNLRKPIDTSVSALYQVSKLLKDGTDEVKSILSYECDIIYECRICRSLFRSIVNLISHKREYCRENFNITLCRGVLDDLSLVSATESLMHMCKSRQTIIKDNVKNDRILRSQVPKIANKRDLSEIVEMLNKKQEENVSKIKCTVSSTPSNQHIHLEPIDTNGSAVYQTVKPSDLPVNTIDLMKGQIAELQDAMNHNAVTLEGHIYESQLEKSDSPIQADISDEENELLIDRLSMNNLICNICNAKFSTKKTLTFHMKTLHTSQRVCYPCPCCTNTFANTWSVHRHLIKVHKKTNEQVRKLRSHIQEKAFHKETNLIEDLEKPYAATASTMKKVTRNDDETHKWRNIYHSESDEERHSCTKCGKKFDRKAALSAHSQYCQVSTAVCNKIVNTVTNQDDQHESNSKTFLNSVLNNEFNNDIEDINAMANTIIKPSTSENTLDTSSRHMSLSPEIIDEHCKTSICVQAVSSLSKEDWDMLENNHNYSFEYNSVDSNNDLDIIVPSITRDDDNESFDENWDHIKSNKKSQSPEIICTNANETNSIGPKIRSEKKRMSSHYNEKELKENDSTEMREDNSGLQQASIKPSETERMENKIATTASFRKLQCLLCKRKFTSMTNLRRHMAIHIGWYRYRCKLCDFKCFVKCDCVAHCNKMHNTQNNRAIIEEVVAEIPQSEYAYNEDIVDITNVEEKMDNLDTMDVTASSYQSEICEDLSNSSDMSTCVTLSNKNAIMNDQVTESYKNKCINIDAEDNNETMMQNLTEYMMNCGPGKLDAHPDLKRMVMEVIFGSSDTSVTKPTDSEKFALNADDDAEIEINVNDKSTPADTSSKESHLISSTSTFQRPTRNRIKPLNQDFVYDLKKALYRKDYDLFKEPPYQLGKTSLHLCDSETLNMRKKAKMCN